MTIGDIFNALDPLLSDAGEAEENLEKQPASQFARRVYIRSVFSYIEGAVWILKTACLFAEPKEGMNRQVSVAELSILLEQSYSLKNNGDPRVIKKNLDLIENIKFTFKYINHLFSGQIDLSNSNEIWNKLRTAKSIRNRLTHPKKASDLLISDEEIGVCETVCSWMNLNSKYAIELMIKSGKES